MDISAISNISAPYYQETLNTPADTKNRGFEEVFQSMLGMINETNEAQHAKDSAQIQFALGESVNTHDLQIAQEKANLTLQYTVAVRDKVLEAYREIMNMQI